MTSKIVVNNIEADAGVSTVTFNSNVVRGGSNLHSTGLALGAGSTVGAVTGVTTYYGDGSQLTGISAGPTLSSGSNDRVITATGANALLGEANLTFSGSVLNINGTSDDTPLMIDTTSNNGAHLRFRKDGSNQHFIGAGGGFSLGDKEDLSFRAYDNLLFSTGNSSTERMRISSNGDLKFNSGYGSAATAYGVRAWINFKAAGGSNTVRGSGNATITDHGTGDFTMNFTTAMPDTGYTMNGTAGYNSGVIVLGLTGSGTHSSPTTSGFRFSVRANYNNASLMDEEYIHLVVVR